MRDKAFYLVTLIIGICVAGFCATAHADIYQYLDDKGVVHFTNVPTGSAAKQPTKIHRETHSASVADAATSPSGYRRSSVPENRHDRSGGLSAAYAEYINSACEKHGVDPSLVHAVVRVESDFNTFALSRKGAMGLMQLMPQTAMDLNVRDSFSPRENIEGGVRYLRSLLDKYEGNVQLALAAYNAGETSVKKWGTVPPFKETKDYVKKIMKLYNGGDAAVAPRHLIYVGYSADGVLLLTDNPSNHQGKQLHRKTNRSL